LPKLAACRFYIKHPKSTNSGQVACFVIYSPICLKICRQRSAG